MLHSVRTSLHYSHWKLFSVFLYDEQLEEIMIGKYCDDTYSVTEKICYCYSDKDVAVCNKLTYMKLKYDGLENAFKRYMIDYCKK